jgi:uncharacterized protein (DUF305 family)
MRIPTSIVAVAVPLALLGAACGDNDNGDDAASTEDQTTSSEANGDHNQADVEFAQMMIPHHRDAVAMAELAPDRAEHPFILDIAQRIQDAQDPEIEQMTGWLDEWGEEVPAEAEGGHDMGGDMPEGGDGMMDELAAASGAAFDRLFAEMMIEHHQGAIDMANEEIANGQSSDAIALAEAIVEAQQAEITELESFLAQPA